MDPITLSSAFATIVGLIINYRQERGAQAEVDYRDFVLWLDYHRHNEIKQLIESSAQIQGEINTLLVQKHEALAEKLEVITGMLASVLSRLDGFSGLAQVITSNVALSQQGFDILKAFVESQGSLIMPCRTHDGYSLLLDRGGELIPDEPRFIEDDLQSLVNLGLIQLDYNGRGEEIYRITRRAVSYINAVKK